MLYTVSGAQGSGKSTVLDRIEALGYPVIQRKTSRSILSDWGKTLDEINDDVELSKQFQDEILTRKIEDEAAAVASSDIWFTERTYMDLFVYALINLGKFNEHSDWLDSYYHRCRQAQHTYAHIFYLQSGLFPVASDGIRGSNHHYSRLVDIILEDYTLSSVHPSSLDVLSVAGLQSRVELIQAHLNKLP